MRGHIDLAGHKLAGLYRPPAKKIPRARMEKCPDAVYRQLWKLADGAVRDTFANHPEYLTPVGRMSARRSLVKRVTGTMYGYATQVARGASETHANVAGGDGAERPASALDGAVQTGEVVTVSPEQDGEHHAGPWRRAHEGLRRHIRAWVRAW